MYFLLIFSEERDVDPENIIKWKNLYNNTFTTNILSWLDGLKLKNSLVLHQNTIKFIDYLVPQSEIIKSNISTIFRPTTCSPVNSQRQDWFKSPTNICSGILCTDIFTRFTTWGQRWRSRNSTRPSSYGFTSFTNW